MSIVQGAILNTWYLVGDTCGHRIISYEKNDKEFKNEVIRPFIMRSASELLIFIFRSEKKMGLLMQSDFAKSDGIKSDLRIRWPKSSDFGTKSDDSTRRILKSKNGIGI